MSRYFAEQLRNGSYHVRDRQDGNRLVYDKERDGNDKPIVVSEDNIEECLRDLNEKETRDINKAKRLANALKRWSPAIVLDRTIDKQECGNEIDPDIPLHPKAMSTEPPPPFQHGVDCVKVKHDGTGYLHGENDDSPYDVDGARYCGRCHHAL